MVNKKTSSIPSWLVKRCFFILSLCKYGYSLQCTPYQKRSEISSENNMSLTNKSYLRGSFQKKKNNDVHHTISLENLALEFSTLKGKNHFPGPPTMGKTPVVNDHNLAQGFNMWSWKDFAKKMREVMLKFPKF